MSRRPKNNFIADLIDLMAMLPWWICLALAAGSYYYLHDLASQPVQAATDVANMAQAAILRALVQGGQYIAPVLFLTAAGLSYFARAHRRELLANTRTRQRLSELSWHDFELLVGEAYRRKGYVVKELGGNGPDGGVDLVLKRNGETILVQCKHWKATSVGVDVARQIFGVMAAEGATGCVVVTSGRFTDAAIDFAKGRNIDLIDGPRLFALMETVPEDGDHTSQAHEQRSHSPLLQTSPPSPTHQPSRAPSCPECGSPMQQRKARKGPNTGQSFWGCTRYPACRGTR